MDYSFLLKNTFRRIMKKAICSLLVILGLTTLSSCAVMMAANTQGTSLETILRCQTKGQLYAVGASNISIEPRPDGGTIEIYQIQKQRGSAPRAFMHGALDISTCLLWEVVGTPLEASLDRLDFYIIKAFVDSNNQIETIELL
jgi:hypothetical protein